MAVQVHNNLVVIYSNINFYRKKDMAVLKKLTDEGVIIRVGLGRNTFYYRADSE